MEPPESKVPDSEKKPRSRFLSRIAIWLAILSVGFGGLVVWDRHDYPIPHAKDPGFGSDPFDDYPDFLDPLREELGEIQTALQNRRDSRIEKQRLRELTLPGSSWEAYNSDHSPHPFRRAVFHFKSDQTLKFDSANEGASSHKIFKFDSFKRVKFDTLELKGDTESEFYKISINKGGNLIFTEKDGDPFLFILLHAIPSK